MKLVVGLSGASGAIYGVRLLEKLRLQSGVEVHLILSRPGEKTLFLETGKRAAELKALVQYSYALEDISGRLASGSFRTDGMSRSPMLAAVPRRAERFISMLPLRLRMTGTIAINSLTVVIAFQCCPQRTVSIQGGTKIGLTYGYFVEQFPREDTAQCGEEERW